MNGVIFLAFTAAACPPCIQMKSDFQDGSLTFIDVREDRDEAARYRIKSTPTIVAVRDGKEVARTSGYKGKQHMKRWMEAVSGGLPRAALRRPIHAAGSVVAGPTIRRVLKPLGAVVYAYGTSP